MADNPGLLKDMPTPSVDALLRCCICSRLLRDPVLLSCLHSCCRVCCGADVGLKGQPATSGMLCPQCNERSSGTTNAFLSSVLTHLFDGVQGAALCDFCLEDGCREEAADHRCADCSMNLCKACLQQHGKHNKLHRVALRSDAAASSAGSRFVPPPSCPLHGFAFNLFCFSCEALKCGMCITGCIGAQHELSPLDGQRVKERADSVAACVRIGEATLVQRAAAPGDGASLVDAVYAARRDHLEKLKSNKKSALDLIESAYQRAEHSLATCYEGLVTQAHQVTRAAQQASRKLAHSLAYSRAVLERGGAAHLLAQMKVLSARLQSLCDDTSKLSVAVDAAKLVILDCDRSGTFESALEKYIGLPRLASDGLPSDQTAGNLLPSDKRSTLVGMLGKDAEQGGVQVAVPGRVRPATPSSALQATPGSTQPAVRGSALPAVPSSTLAAVPSSTLAAVPSSALLAVPGSALLPMPGSILLGVPGGALLPVPSSALMPVPGSRLLPVPGSTRTVMPGSAQPAVTGGALCLNKCSASFSLQHKCWDLALAKDGSLLLAAYGEGLLEYDSDGTLLATWRPPPKGKVEDSVYTVDVVDDGKVAVGLLRSCTVVLLRRECPAVGRHEWTEHRRVALQGEPWRLASHSSGIVAVSHGRMERGKYGPGATFELLSLFDSKVMLRRGQQYGIASIAVTGRTVVVASSKQQLSHDPRSRWYLIDCYNHEGALLWRYESNESVWDIVAEPHDGATVYLALGDSRRVVAVHGDDSHIRPAEILAIGAVRSDTPVRLSLCHSGHHTAVALLFFDLRSVAVYTSKHMV